MAFGQLILGGLAAGIVAYWFTSSVIQAAFMGVALGITVAVTTIAMDWTGNLRVSNEKSSDT